MRKSMGLILAGALAGAVAGLFGAGGGMVLVPLLTLPVLRLITADPVLLGAMVIIAGCPSAVMVTVLAIQYGRDAEYTSKGILLNTVLSMVTLPTLVYLLL